MNPPFGTKNNEGIDVAFLERALAAVTSDGAVYSFHKTSTRGFIVRKFQDRGLEVSVLAEMKFKIPQMYKIHRSKAMFLHDYQKTFGICAYQSSVQAGKEPGPRIDPNLTQGGAANLPVPPLLISNDLCDKNTFKTQTLTGSFPPSAEFFLGNDQKHNCLPSPQPFITPDNSPTLQIQNITSSRTSPNGVAGRVTTRTPGQPDNALVHRVSELESVVLSMREKYEKQIEHYKTQLVQQLEHSSKIKAKTKKLKEEYQASQEQLKEHNKMREKYTQAIQQMEEERQQRLNENQAKSIESRRLLMAIRAELELQKQANDDAKHQILSRNREKEELGKNLNQLLGQLGERDQTLAHLRKEVVDMNQNYKLLKQELVEKRFNSAHLKLRIAHANCVTQIAERSKLQNPESYNLTAWKCCQDEIRRIIERNQAKYDKFIESLRNSESPDVIVFEEVPSCPLDNPTLEVFPIQRYDDILLGRLPAVFQDQQASSNNHHITELESIAGMLDTSRGSNYSQPPSSAFSKGSSVANSSLDDESAVIDTFSNEMPALANQLKQDCSISSPPSRSEATHGRGRGRARNSHIQQPPVTSSQPCTSLGRGGRHRAPVARAVNDLSPAYNNTENIVVPNPPIDPSTTPSTTTRRPRIPDSVPPLRRPHDSVNQTPLTSTPHPIQPSPQITPGHVDGYQPPTSITRQDTPSFTVEPENKPFNFQFNPFPKVQLKKQPSLDSNCVICLRELNLSDILLSDCAHRFHKNCVETWYPSLDLSCPICHGGSGGPLPPPQSDGIGILDCAEMLAR